jgi:hypothetical protein
MLAPIVVWSVHHRGALFSRQDSGLQKWGVGQAPFAEVVELGGQAEHIHLILSHAQRARYLRG